MTINPAASASHLVTRILHLPITSDADAFGTAARATERVVVSLADPSPEDQGELESFVVAAIESELDRRGAAPAGWRSDEGLETKLSDQLYRIRLLGAGGLALRFSRLDAIANGAGQISAQDSHTLRQLFVLAEREPLQLYLPEPVAALRVIGAPQQLSDWLTAGSKAGRIASIEYEPSSAADANVAKPGARNADDPALAPPPLEAFVTSVGPDQAAEQAPERELPSALPGPSMPVSDGPPTGTNLSRDPSSSTDSAHSQRCVAWAAQLQNMSGPKVHGSVERAFLTAYLPLSREVATGKAPRETQATVEKWAEGFAHSYATAFKNLTARAKRPRMVKDVVDVSLGWLGQHGARQCQLLLVSGMRFDLGQRLNEEIERRLVGRAVCADQTILWAALPSNAESQQIGDTSVRSARSVAKPAPEVATTSSSSIESLRVGTRELFRLEQMSAELAKAGEAEPVRLQRLATTLADAIVPWMREQPPETLVVIFGDHGFHWHSSERGTSAGQRGGALPEQVLVPASAWLLADARSRARVAPGLH